MKSSLRNDEVDRLLYEQHFYTWWDTCEYADEMLPLINNIREQVGLMSITEDQLRVLYRKYNILRANYSAARQAMLDLCTLDI